MQIESDKSAKFQAQWEPVMTDWSNRTVTSILIEGVVPGTRKAVECLAELSRQVVSIQTTDTDVAGVQEVTKVLIPIMLATVAAILRFSYPDLEQPFLQEIKSHNIPGIEGIEQKILDMYQKRLAQQESANHA